MWECFTASERIARWTLRRPTYEKYQKEWTD